MNLPKQPVQQKVLKYAITSLIVAGSIWSASGLEITLEKILKAPEQIAILVGAMFPLDLSQEAIERILPKVAESLFIAWAGTVIGAIFSFSSFLKILIFCMFNSLYLSFSFNILFFCNNRYFYTYGI